MVKDDILRIAKFYEIENPKNYSIDDLLERINVNKKKFTKTKIASKAKLLGLKKLNTMDKITLIERVDQVLGKFNTIGRRLKISSLFELIKFAKENGIKIKRYSDEEEDRLDLAEYLYIKIINAPLSKKKPKSPSNIDKLNISELKQLAKDYGIKPTKLNKEQLKHYISADKCKAHNFGCSDNKICDISSNKCVDNKYLKKDLLIKVVNGSKIAGISRDIDKIQPTNIPKKAAVFTPPEKEREIAIQSPVFRNMGSKDKIPDIQEVVPNDVIYDRLISNVLQTAILAF
jgi:hypothetical protein